MVALNNGGAEERSRSWISRGLPGGSFSLPATPLSALQQLHILHNPLSTNNHAISACRRQEGTSVDLKLMSRSLILHFAGFDEAVLQQRLLPISLVSGLLLIIVTHLIMPDMPTKYAPRNFSFFSCNLNLPVDQG